MTGEKTTIYLKLLLLKDLLRIDVIDEDIYERTARMIMESETKEKVLVKA